MRGWGVGDVDAGGGGGHSGVDVDLGGPVGRGDCRSVKDVIVD